MVYVNGSEHSIAAARYAICLASFSGAELIACYIVNTRAVVGAQSVEEIVGLIRGE